MLLPEQIAECHETSGQQNRNINMEVSIIEAAGRCLGFESKKKEATVEFVSRKNFHFTPTGCGKSVYDASIPLILDQLKGNIGSLVVVVSPLNTLMKKIKWRAKDWKLRWMLDLFADAIAIIIRWS